MSAKNIIDPLLMFDGGDTDTKEEGQNPDQKVKSLWCSHDEDEDCNANCTFQKFPKGTEGDNSPAAVKYRKKDRINFVKKTYGILLCQLIFTSVFVASAILVPSIGVQIKDTKLWIIAAIVALASILLLVFGSTTREEDDNGKLISGGKPFHMVVPINYTLLAIFTLATSVMVAKISLASKPQLVFEAFVLTTAAVLGITIFAFTSFRKIDGVKEFSIMAPALSAVGLIFAVSGLFVLVTATDLAPDDSVDSNQKSMRVLFAAIGVALFALIMLFDTSQVIGGKSMMFELGPECYILGALQLYLEIVNMFVLLLVILGSE